MLKFIKDWTLPLAMAIGAIGYKWLGELAFLSPYFIFLMLLLTFCKINPKDLKLMRSHWYILAFEILGSVAAYYLVKPVNEIAAQGVLVCIICPTATAGAVITGKLGGSMESITSYTLLCNIAVAFAVPAIFPLLCPMESVPGFWDAFLLIIKKVFPLLICPFLLALLMRRFTKRAYNVLREHSSLSFYLWAVGLIIATAKTVKSIVEHSNIDNSVFIWMIITTIVACALQFGLGKYFGSKCNDTIAGGQSLGQKNTLLAIWMADTYLHPLSALSAGLYVIWHNSFNGWQLYHKRKQDEKNSIC